MVKQVITAKDVQEAAALGTKTIPAPPGEFIVTPMAFDEATALGITIDERADSMRSGPAAISPHSKNDDLVREICTRIQNRLPGDPQSANVESLVRKVVEQKVLQNKSYSDSSKSPDVGTDSYAADMDRVLSQAMEEVKGRIPPSVDTTRVERLVREAVASRLAGKSKGNSTRIAAGSSGVCLLTGKKAGGNETPSVPADGKSIVAEFLNCDAGAELSAGHLEWEKGVFKRTVEFPEIGIVIEGKLRLGADGETMELGPGDMVYFPAGTSVKYDAGSKVKMACVNRRN